VKRSQRAIEEEKSVRIPKTQTDETRQKGKFRRRGGVLGGTNMNSTAYKPPKRDKGKEGAENSTWGGWAKPWTGGAAAESIAPQCTDIHEIHSQSVEYGGGGCQYQPAEKRKTVAKIPGVHWWASVGDKSKCLSRAIRKRSPS